MIFLLCCVIDYFVCFIGRRVELGYWWIVFCFVEYWLVIGNCSSDLLIVYAQYCAVVVGKWYYLCYCCVGLDVYFLWVYGLWCVMGYLLYWWMLGMECWVGVGFGYVLCLV